MKLKLDRKFWTLLGCVFVLMLVAPFAFEFVILADYVGVEFAVTFMLFYFRTAFETFIEKMDRIRRQINYVIESLSCMFVFQPRNYSAHATASCLVVVFSGSLLVACALWLPIFALNSSGFI